jgi:hypothetical protein
VSLSDNGRQTGVKIGTMKQSTEEIRKRFERGYRMNCRDILDLIEAVDWLLDKDNASKVADGTADLFTAQ